MKFDRVSGSYLFTELNETETFSGTGAVELFYLKWPIDLKTNTNDFSRSILFFKWKIKS